MNNNSPISIGEFGWILPQKAVLGKLASQKIEVMNVAQKSALDHYDAIGKWRCANGLRCARGCFTNPGRGRC
jgi:hypothetical protein